MIIQICAVGAMLLCVGAGFLLRKVLEDVFGLRVLAIHTELSAPCIGLVLALAVFVAGSHHMITRPKELQAEKTQLQRMHQIKKDDLVQTVFEYRAALHNADCVAWKQVTDKYSLIFRFEDLPDITELIVSDC